MYHPPVTETVNDGVTNRLDPEFIELYNSNPFFEDLGGYRITGDIEFTFPPNTRLAGLSYLVLAKNPADFQAAYPLAGVPVFGYGIPEYETNVVAGVTNVTTNIVNSLSREGTIRLRNNSGGVVLEVSYSNDNPWPVGTDGTGHSLVLARPSYGEADPRAWSISDHVGGSPGQAEAFAPDPLRNVLINEFLAHTDPPLFDYIELHNRSALPVDISSCVLTDDATTNKFVVPAFTTLEAGGFVFFDERQLGFRLEAAGETIYLWNPDHTRLLDVVQFEAQENGVAMGRAPDGAEEFHRLQARTPGANNSPILVHDLVINEIMYDPISGDSDDEYVELYNQGAGPMALGGWRFEHGIEFTFPANATIPSHGYVVVAKNVGRLLANYPATLSPTNTFGNFSGSLSGKGERLAVAFPDTVISTNAQGKVETNLLHVVVDEVTYGTGGNWGNWSHGGGSSLELRDPRSNHRLAFNWGDSDETTKAPWTSLQVTGPMDNGGETANNLQVYLMGAGECLLDDVKCFVAPGGPNLVANSTFETGLSQWSIRGDHIRSTLEYTGYNSARSLHVRASDHGDSLINRLRVPLTNSLPTGAAASVTISAKVRWLCGWPEILLRTHGNYLELADRMRLPSNLGTPGAVNSRAVANAPPAIFQVGHAPVVPAALEPVVVTARVDDPDGISSVTLKYREDPNAGYAVAAMRDDGLGGDALAGDGVFSATLPGEPQGVLVAFQVSATDSRGATSLFPIQDASYLRPFECLVRFGDPVITSQFGTYRQWFTAANVSDWINRPVLSNERIYGTFVYGAGRAVYGMGAKYSGSPYHQGFSSPVTSDCHYSLEMPRDDLVLGTDNFNKIHAPGNGPFSDPTLQREQTCYWLARSLGLPWNYRRYVNMVVNGNRRGGTSAMMEDSQTPGGDVLDAYFPGDTDGSLYKLQPWFEADDAASGSVGFRNRSWCTLLRFTTVSNAMTVLDRARYRNNFLVRSAHTTANDFQPVFNLISAANTPSSQGLAEALDAVADVEEWFRIFAVEHASGNWDSFGARNEQNMYGYQPKRGKMQLLIWDWNIVLGASSWGPGAELFTVTDGQSGPLDTVMQSFYSYPPFRRTYLRALKELCNNGLVAANVGPVLDARYAAFLANGISATSPSGIKTWISQARANILATVAAEDAASFSISGSTTFSSLTNFITLSGIAPVEVKSITVNGQVYPITWVTVRGWRMRLALGPGVNVFNLQGLDVNGNPLPGFTATATVNYLGAPPDDAPGNVVFNEILYRPAVSNAAFIEILNRSATTAFDLAGWRVNGLGYTFPGVALAPGQLLVLTRDRAAFAAAYGGAAFDQFDGELDPDGETLTLLKPGAMAGEEIVVDRVRYEPGVPWAAAASGTSLQLVDAAQDNSRVANWSTASAMTGGGTQSLIVITNRWKFDQSGADLGTAWRTPGFDAAAWPVGTALLCVESATLPAPKNTPLTLGRTTYYFRTNFVFAGKPAAASLRMSVVLDDGAVFYLNGAEVYRLGMPAGTITYTNFANRTVGDATLEGPFLLPVTNLVEGTNLIAVEVHQVSATSSDIVFGLSLEASASPALAASPGAGNQVAASLPAFPPLWLNELQAGNLTGPIDNFGEHDPWVELHNAGTDPLALDGCFLSDSYSNLTRWAFPAGTIVPPAGHLVVWCDDQTNQTAGASLHAGFRLRSNDGSVALSRRLGGTNQVLDYLNYTNLRANWSYGDFPDGQPFYRDAFFVPTPGAANTNAAPPLTVFINEWMADNAGTLADPADGRFEDWFELYNPGPDLADLGGGYLTDNLTNPFQFRIPNNGHYRIPAGGHLLVWADNDTGQNSTNRADLHAGFALNKDGEAIGLFAADGTPIDTVVFGAQTRDMSEGRFPDGAAAFRAMSTPTPRAANVAPNSPPVLAAISNAVVTLGQTLCFTAEASDVDAPPQSFSFSLANAPIEAAIHPTTGLFTWTPTTAPATNTLSVIVADNGLPSLSATQTFTVVVALPPVVDGVAVSDAEFRFRWPTVAGQQFQVEYKDDLGDEAWLPLGEPLTGTGEPLSFTSSVDEVSQRFFRLRVLP